MNQTKIKVYSKNKKQKNEKVISINQFVFDP